ncbi:MAG: peroxide stress protein YaaA [Aeromicrobium sp.]|uniref:YaaA family protein n=1 Tax=Aeromicrobium sp. TaxID=1871063 RepID=UPI0039E5A458
MLILLPPSEGKTRPDQGEPLDLDSLSSPSLNPTREQILRSLVRLSQTKRGAEILGLGPTQAEHLERNAALPSEPTAPASEVYTGVLFGELGLATLDADARARAEERLAVASALFGLVRPGDRIPAYKLSGATTLPRLGTVASRWKPVMGRAVAELAGDGLVLDLRSGTYAQFGHAEGLPRASVRVLTETNGVRKVVSHFNKATKGQLVRALLVEGATPDSVDELVEVWSDLGWTVEVPDTAPGKPIQLDIVTT